MNEFMMTIQQTKHTPSTEKRNEVMLDFTSL